MKVKFEDTLSEILFYLAFTLYAIVVFGKIAYEFGESLAQSFC